MVQQVSLAGRSPTRQLRLKTAVAPALEVARALQAGASGAAGTPGALAAVVTARFWRLGCSGQEPRAASKGPWVWTHSKGHPSGHNTLRLQQVPAPPVGLHPPSRNSSGPWAVFSLDPMPMNRVMARRNRRVPSQGGGGGVAATTGVAARDAGPMGARGRLPQCQPAWRTAVVARTAVLVPVHQRALLPQLVHREPMAMGRAVAKEGRARLRRSSSLRCPSTLGRGAPTSWGREPWQPLQARLKAVAMADPVVIRMARAPPSRAMCSRARSKPSTRIGWPRR
mmetsp:Transcript_71947/g.153808  ORF Transcript_71947/g.153808 Transcript_71947/m.153808 type:complete len:282 (+) Transcript_71947:1058-1903(+)